MFFMKNEKIKIGLVANNIDILIEKINDLENELSNGQPNIESNNGDVTKLFITLKEFIEK